MKTRNEEDAAKENSSGKCEREEEMDRVDREKKDEGTHGKRKRRKSEGEEIN